MLPVSAPASVLHRLRQETQPYHAALEQSAFNRALMAGTITSDVTTHFLSRLYGFLRPYEAALRAHAFPAEWEVAARCRAHLIEQDLAQAAGLPQCPDMPPLRTRAQLLGALYVVEGSTLGGQIITRQLARAGITARTYFTGYAEQTGARWKSFCGLLSAAALHPADQDQVVQSAIVTFQKLHAWIEQP
ncbi:heme oxygenase [Hymenobacter luteus]|uniref:Heme oxygenase n=2 Tax=Hymenobacter TaxID=89966 RepID=A0A7W9T2H4_9BACT|nr:MULTISPECIES: biliverdin-producing heme oxygenase [Hymenobacter]MBB4601977.1 heme oxygenase [Hymenobacter latericoloratus]MBB6059594.1 heme oxygenase [Hymenobacter luteus]